MFFQRNVVGQIGNKLRERDEMVTSTLPYLAGFGVTGFCWLSPKELISGLNHQPLVDDAPEPAPSGRSLASCSFAITLRSCSS